MKNFRRLKKIILTALWSSSLLVFVFLFTLGRNKWKATAFCSRCARFWARGMARILNMKITVCGDPSSAAGKLVLSNHLGYLDIIAEGTLFPLRFAPKAEMRKWPFFGPLVAVSRPVWIDRKNRIRAAQTAGEIADTLKNDLSMLVYPEGTSTDGKNGLLPFKSTAFESVLNTDVSMLPVLVTHKESPEGSFDPAWYGDISFLPHVWGVLGLKEIHTCVYIMQVEDHLPGEDRKSLASRMHDLMDGEYRRICALSRS